MTKQCHHNASFANLIISDLTHLGVTTFCIGSGSRSAPLALALKNNPSTESVLYYDERSLGFFALGLAKAHLKPICIIVTSGSAVANLAPAVMEAYMEGVPLIIITCDRPFEDLDRGMNQTCKQEDYFGSFTAFSKHLPAPPHDFDSSVISSHISYCVNKCRRARAPVHLNISFKLPRLNETLSGDHFNSYPKHLPIKTVLADESLEYITDLLSAKERGVIIVGGNFNKNGVGAIIELAEKINYPILADPLSGIREHGTSPMVISHYNQIIHHTKKLDILNPEVVIFLGNHVISKNLLLWTKSLKNCQQILVNEKSRHQNPSNNIDISIDINHESFANSVAAKTKRKPPSSYPSLWKGYSLTVENSVETFFDEQEALHEPMAITSLVTILEETPFPVFLGNSLTIRYGDNFLFPKKITPNIYGNRGVSGIDGNIATAAGICKGLNSPLVAVMGDLTFLHDTSSLNLIKKQNLPLIIVVINNNGGGIFDFLPYSEKKDFISSHISPTHDLQIGNLASSFAIPFWKPTTANEYTKMITHLLEEKSSGIIEIPSNREENLKIHAELDGYVEKKLQQSVKKEKTSYFSFSKKKNEQTPYVFQDS